MQGLRDHFDAFLLLLHPESDLKTDFPRSNPSLPIREPLPSGLAKALQNIGLLASITDPISGIADERPAPDA